MNIFITGGTGFIGKYVVATLLRRKKHRLLVLTRDIAHARALFPNEDLLSYAQGDLEHIAALEPHLKRFQPDVCLHLAWEGIPDYGVVASVKNLNQGISLFQAAARSGCKKIIATGSCWEYEANNAFTAAKNALRELGGIIAKEHDSDFLWARLFYVYGPGQKETSLLPFLCGRVKAGAIPELKNPHARHDFVYVQDVAEALVRLAELRKKKGRTCYEIGTGKRIAIKNILGIMCRLQGMRAPAIAPGAPANRFGMRAANTEAIRKDTRWKPKTHMTDGIKNMLV